MDHFEHCAALEEELQSVALLLDNGALDLPVPSCPDWTIADLVIHLGSVHRWAEHMVRGLSPTRIGFDQLGLGQPEPSGPWIREGGQVLLSTLRAADPDAPMWAWGTDQHVRFWSRRQLHETLVHRIDIELALGLDPSTEPAVAADAIDEFLVNLGPAASFSPRVKNLRGDGTRVAFRANDHDRDWVIVLRPDGFAVEGGPAAEGATATLSGPSLALLLVLYRRWPLATPGLEQSGDGDVVDFWLANSALE
jgi:uncharacterized protein (TIGR03083 family)